MNATRCWCRRCETERGERYPHPSGKGPLIRRFIVCPDCGNKRCPKATDHRLACTQSNAQGQPGSAYGSTTVLLEVTENREFRSFLAEVPASVVATAYALPRDADRIGYWRAATGLDGLRGHAMTWSIVEQTA
jgi:hypothetical protein